MRISPEEIGSGKTRAEKCTESSTQPRIVGFCWNFVCGCTVDPRKRRNL